MRNFHCLRSELEARVILKGDGRVKGNQSGQGLGSVITGGEVVLSGPSGLLISDVLLDLDAVEEPVLGGDLGALRRVLEDLGPSEHGVDVILEGGELAARADGVGEHPDDVTQVLHGLDGVQVDDIIQGLVGILS